MPVSFEFQAFTGFRRRVDTFNDHIADAVDGDPTAIHQARVASRRLREAIPATGLGTKGKSLRCELRAVAKALGRVRELDVTLHVLDDRRAIAGNSTVAIDLLSPEVAYARANARKQLARTITSRKMVRLSRKLSDAATALDARAVAKGRRFSMTCRWVADLRLARRADALAEMIERAGTVYSTTMLHEVRIALKKFRYAFELASETRPIPRAAQQLTTLKTAQRLLGELHDLSVLLSWAYHVQGSAVLDLTTRRAVNAFTTTLENDCRFLHARFIRQRGQLLELTARLDVDTSEHQERAAS